MPTNISLQNISNDADDGSLDVFVKAIEEVLDSQYKQKRVQGNAYAQLLAQLLQNAMSQAVEFSLGKDKAEADADIARKQLDVLAKEIELKDSQLATDTKNRSLLDAKITLSLDEHGMNAERLIALEKENVLLTKQATRADKELEVLNKDLLLKDATIVKMGHENALLVKDLTLKDKQIEKMGAEITHLNHQNTLILKDITLKDKQIEKITAEIISLGHNNNLLIKELEVKDALILKMGHDNDLLEKKIEIADKEIEKISAEILKMGFENSVLEQEVLMAAQKLLVMIAEVEKIGHENALLVKKLEIANSELALYIERVKSEAANTVDPAGGVLGAQIDLHDAQAAGISARIVTENRKINADAWSVLVAKELTTAEFEA